MSLMNVYHSFDEDSFEIIKILGGFGQIFSFLLLKLPYLAKLVLEVQHDVIGFLDSLRLYLFCSQIWLNPLVADCHFWSNMEIYYIKKSSDSSSLNHILLSFFSFPYFFFLLSFYCYFFLFLFELGCDHMEMK
jgi:hypothetical protein